MSNHQDNPVLITVPEVITSEEGVTLYQVVVAVGPVVYRVKHRYSEFESMHSKIVEDGIEKDLLPPKKLIGNKDPAFIMKRRKDLETYLQTVYHFLEKSLPRVLAEFLDFPTYDIHYVLQDLASHYHETDLRSVSPVFNDIFFVAKIKLLSGPVRQTQEMAQAQLRGAKLAGGLRYSYTPSVRG